MSRKSTIACRLIAWVGAIKTRLRQEHVVVSANVDSLKKELTQPTIAVSRLATVKTLSTVEIGRVCLYSQSQRHSTRFSGREYSILLESVVVVS